MPRIRRLPRLQQSERLQKPHIAHDRLPVPLQFARELRNGYRPRTNSLQHPDAFGRECLYQVRRVFKNHSDLGRYAFTPIQLARALAGSRKDLVHGPVVSVTAENLLRVTRSTRPPAPGRHHKTPPPAPA